MRISGAKKILKVLLLAFLSTIFFVPFLLVALICFVYRTSVLTILKFKFGSKFGGLLSGTDALFSTEVASKSIINALVIVKTEDNFEEFSRKLKEAVNTKIFQNSQSDPKFLSTRHKFFGYNYCIQKQVEMDDCVRSINFKSDNEEISKKELLNGISGFAKSALPCNNHAFWEFLLCEKPVKWNETEKSYAILLRFHHSLADGLNLIRFMLSMLCDSHHEEKSSQKSSPSKFWVGILDILGSIFVFLMTPVLLISFKLFYSLENGGVEAPSLSGQRILVAKVEEYRECLKIIKEIKQKVEHTSFDDVLLAAISRSLSNYFQKEGKNPNLTSFRSNLTVLLRKSQLTKGKTTELRNQFSQENINIPIVYNYSNAQFSYWKSFVETLEKVKIETENMKTSNHSKVIFGVLNVLAYFLPEPILSRIFVPSYLPLGITNLPGPAKTARLGDLVIEDIMFWVPWIEPIGMTLGFFTYDERLQIALNVDKAIISNEDDAQEVVDGIYQSIIQVDSKI